MRSLSQYQFKKSQKRHQTGSAWVFQSSCLWSSQLWPVDQVTNGSSHGNPMVGREKEQFARRGEALPRNWEEEWRVGTYFTCPVTSRPVQYICRSYYRSFVNVILTSSGLLGPQTSWMYSLPSSTTPNLSTCLMDCSHLSPHMLALVTHTCHLALASSHLSQLYLKVKVVAQ